MPKTDHFLKTANRKAIAEKGIEVILAKLEAGKYMNAAHEDADRKMLTYYLNGGV